MEAINYIAGEKNMVLTEDAQIVQGVSGNGCYLPAGTGKIALKGDRNELSVSLWRQWDGVVEQDAKRGVFSFTNIVVFFDNKTDLLTVIINGFKAITDIKDEQKQAHWCFTFAKNGRFIIYKDAKEVYSLIAGDKPVDMTDGFTLGGGKTHATFDEVRVYKTVLTQGEVNGLFYLVSKGTQIKQLENIVQSATPKYLGVTETVPATRTAIITKGERLGAQDANPGDWVLMSKTSGGWKCGVCYRWTGTLWVNLEPEANYVEQYHACLLHICEIPELMKNTGHFGALFAKQIIAQEAFIKKLAADQAFLKELIVQRLRIDSDKNSDKDFEAWFDETNGLKIKNRGEEIFWVEPNGDANFYGISFKKEGNIKKQRFEKPDHNITPTKDETLWYKEEEANNVRISMWADDITINAFVREWHRSDSGGGIGLGGYTEMVTLCPYRCRIEYKKSTITLKNGETRESTINKMSIIGIGVFFNVEKASNTPYQLTPPQPHDYGEYNLHEVKIIFNALFKNLLIIDNIPHKTEISVNALPKGTLYKDESGFIKIS